MTAEEFIPFNLKSTVENGEIKWASPSNIALVKYWGKKEHQIPENQSISFTLSDCKTITKLKYEAKAKTTNSFDFQVYLDGERKPDFEPKIEVFFNRIQQYFPFLKTLKFTIETENTFPHSSGIASSASGMSALALCLMSIEKQLNPEITESYFNKKASFIARLGSGSACRSIQGDLVVWGAHNEIENSSDLYGVKYPYQVHDNFKNYQDTILLVDKGEKQVSSTVGHNLMHGHPFAKQRFKQANNNISEIKNILKSGDLKAFIALVESEALTLHAMMMTSMPYFILMKPNTLEIINKIWSFRKATNLNICFTLDAGANVHILYPEKEKEQILEFIKTQLVAYCQNGHYICDTVGLGAKKM
ncbi:diphosphomevalonate/mevalonate 3,5-bisphosphate decarboxylase family protein [Lacinutrix sp. 5H-3-7-4]|uniref:diphosphomevalonate/mevalonate 3,5-bisphosphate decarboxylase family protein n=1 Tax=Lacinutrix sp. (strain 5H-3-7-4) TaxID=983544 RepID=UPI00020A3B09|nr:diphosphomevalonate decarboxylase [Lacinutrix sp. 5H-3-7-4]AEH00510.1 GHMP kinase [Lacinutrix sp. 5H-3-7-4]